MASENQSLKVPWKIKVKQKGQVFGMSVVSMSFELIATCGFKERHYAVNASAGVSLTNQLVDSFQVDLISAK